MPLAPGAFLIESDKYMSVQLAAIRSSRHVQDNLGTNPVPVSCYGQSDRTIRPHMAALHLVEEVPQQPCPKDQCHADNLALLRADLANHGFTRLGGRPDTQAPKHDGSAPQKLPRHSRR